MPGNFTPSLVVISVLVAILASFTALSMASRVASSYGGAARWWIAGGAFAMSVGIWAMHFIGMLAFRLPVPLGYDIPITALSWLLALAASWLALLLVSQPRLPASRLAAGALVMGLGINAMHYTGMAAMRMQPGIIYEPWLFAASVAIAVGASGAALWIAFRLRHDGPRRMPMRAAAAILMGAAIAGMHYTGMAAAHFPAGSVCMAVNSLNNDALAVVTVTGTLSVLSFALLTSLYDARLKARSRTLTVSQALAEERKTLLESERVARTQAEHASAIKDEFLATLSHELRTPLNSILGWAQVLRRQTHDQAALTRGLETIERNARAQAQLIDDLLDMSRILAGKVRLELEPVDPREVIEAAVAVVTPGAAARAIVIEQRYEAVERILADPNRLQQMFWNLLSNAVKFSLNGCKVTITLSQANGLAVIEVSDTGIGIAPDFLPFVFDRFRQADASTTRRYGGLGLGLSIVRHLAELHGGSVEVTSAGKDLGATFTVSLPLAGAGATAADTVPARGGSAAPGIADFVPVDLSGIRVLVIDDDMDARTLAASVLEQCGAQVISAHSVDDALAQLAQLTADVIVSDLGMPDADGFDFIRRLRLIESERGQGLPAPVIVLSAFTRDSDRARAHEAGFASYLTKPVEPSLLVHTIRANAGPQAVPSLSSILPP